MSQTFADYIETRNTQFEIIDFDSIDESLEIDESTLDLLENLGNLKKIGDDDTVKRFIKADAGYMRNGSSIGSKSKVHDKEDATDKNINHHIASLGLKSSDKESDKKEHGATIVHVNNKPHSIIRSNATISHVNKNPDRGWNAPRPQIPSVEYSHRSVRPIDVKNHIKSLIDQHGADNVKLQKIGADAETTLKRHNSKYYGKDDSLDVIKQHAASKFVDARIKDNSETKAKHLKDAEDHIEKLHAAIKAGKSSYDLDTHIKNIKASAELHARAQEGTSSSKYSGRESDIADAKRELSKPGKDRSIKKAKSFINRANS